MERAQRRITVNYARRQQGRKMYAAQSTHLPFKINMSGVIPPIFASSILMFPATIAQFFGQSSADANAFQRGCRRSARTSVRDSRCTCCCTRH